MDTVLVDPTHVPNLTSALIVDAELTPVQEVISEPESKPEEETE